MLVYDEIRMINAHFHFVFGYSVPGTGTELAVCNAAVTFDPSAGAPTTSYGLLEESFNSGPLVNIIGNAGGVGQVVTRPNGRMDLVTGRAPRLAPISTSDCPGSAWICLDGATPPTMLVQQAYCAPLGTGGISTITYFTSLDVEFRLRT
jgi:hypothetical protein